MSPAREDIRQALYALKRRRWREGYLRWVRGGRLVMRVEPMPERVLAARPELAE